MAPPSVGRSAGRRWPAGWGHGCAWCGGSWGRALSSSPRPPRSAAPGPRRSEVPCSPRACGPASAWTCALCACRR
eukprot:4573900-Alexandrium_andersonii.AAC.1